jgi:hypothetical protein
VEVSSVHSAVVVRIHGGQEYARARRSGRFSDRTICYLASGKPVLVQDTGLRGLHPASEGLLTFETVAEALAGVERISRDLVRQSRRARMIAEEYLP